MARDEHGDAVTGAQQAWKEAAHSTVRPLVTVTAEATASMPTAALRQWLLDAPSAGRRSKSE